MSTVQPDNRTLNAARYGAALLLLLSLVAAEAIAEATKDSEVNNARSESLEMSLAPFDRVELIGRASVRFVQGESNSLSAVGDTNRLSVSVTSGVLTIDTTQVAEQSGEDLAIVLNYDHVTAIRSRGAMRVHASGMALSELALSGNGSSQFDLQNVELGSLKVDGAGAQRILMSGAVATQDIKMVGAGVFNGVDLDAASATVVINGAGSVSVASRNTLDVEILGVGNVAYRGEPEITARILGPGTIAGLEG